MRQVFCLLIILIHTGYTQNLFDKFREFQNKDGSFGEKNKEVVTSCVLMPYIYRQYLPSHRKYGSLTKRALKYLCARAENLSREKVDERHLYTLWALSDSYKMTGVSLIHDSSKLLAQSILADLKRQGSWDFSSIISKERILPAFLAINSLSVAEIIEFDEKRMISSLIKQAQVSQNYDKDYKLILELMKTLWDLDLSIVDSVKKEGVGLILSPQILAEFISGLNNSNVEMRKKTLEQCLLLNEATLKTLLHELENSAITELNLAAKEIRKEKFQKPVPVKKVEIKLETEELPVSWLYLMDSYVKFKGEREARTFKLKLLRVFGLNRSYEAMKGFKPMTLKEMPKYLDSHKILSSASFDEQKLLNAAFGSIALDDLFYDTLKMSVKAMKDE